MDATKDFIVANGTRSPIPVCVERSAFEKLGFMVENELGAGFWSAVHAATFENKQIAVKMGNNLSTEAQTTRKAQTLGLGPAVYTFGKVPALRCGFSQKALKKDGGGEERKEEWKKEEEEAESREKIKDICRQYGKTMGDERRGEKGGGSTIDFIAMEKYHCTLQKLIEEGKFNPVLITSLYEFGKRCFDNNLLHRDLHARNIMKQTKDGNSFKLVDFEQSLFIQGQKKAILAEWKALFYHLKGQTPSYLTFEHIAFATAIRRMETEWIPYIHPSKARAMRRMQNR